MSLKFLFAISAPSSAAAVLFQQHPDITKKAQTTLAATSPSSKPDVSSTCPKDAPALLKRLYMMGQSGFSKNSDFPDDEETMSLVRVWQEDQKKKDSEDPAPPADDKKAALFLDGIDDDVKACKDKLPDKHAYANCVLKAMVGEMANLDFLNKMPDGEKKNFCATTPEMFRMLAAILQSRFERSSAAAAAAPAPDAGSAPAEEEGPSDAVFKQMQDLAFVQAALEQFEKFCKGV